MSRGQLSEGVLPERGHSADPPRVVLPHLPPMKHSPRRPAHAHLRHLLGGALLLAVSAGCVSQRTYDEVLESSRFYQDAYHDVQAYVAQLEAERATLLAELETAGEIDPEVLEAKLAELLPDPVIDRQLDELERIAQAIGGAPGDVVPISVEGGYGFSLKESVLFDSGSADLREDGRRILVELADDIASRPYQTLWVRGHTDAVPVSRPATLQRFPRGNLELSGARALEVAALLIAEGGLDADSIAIAGFGANRPIAPNDTAEGRRKNRRVELFVLERDPEDARADGPRPVEAGNPAAGGATTEDAATRGTPGSGS